MGKMRTPAERIASLRDKIAKKRANIEDYNVTLSNAQTNIEKAKKAIEGYEKQISALEAELLAKTLHKKGIDISQIAAAIEAGLFDSSVPEKPPDMSETEPETKSATYSTENTNVEIDVSDEKEDLNDE